MLTQRNSEVNRTQIKSSKKINHMILCNMAHTNAD